MKDVFYYINKIKNIGGFNMNVQVKEIRDAKIGDILFSYDVLDKPYCFMISQIEDKTEGGSKVWGRVFYDKENNFTTEKAIAKLGGIFGKMEERKGFALQIN